VQTGADTPKVLAQMVHRPGPVGLYLLPGVEAALSGIRVWRGISVMRVVEVDWLDG
jgi:hypothetical protein